MVRGLCHLLRTFKKHPGSHLLVDAAWVIKVSLDNVQKVRARRDRGRLLGFDRQGLSLPHTLHGCIVPLPEDQHKMYLAL